MGVSSLPAKSGPLATVMLQAATSPFIWLGLAIYGMSVLTWLWVLSKVDVSVAYPFVGISFILTVGIGALYLHEHVSPLRWFGTLLIVAGCVVIARSA
jgi:drug/metabolite transporter (DMT)-like permease